MTMRFGEDGFGLKADSIFSNALFLRVSNDIIYKLTVDENGNLKLERYDRAGE